MPQASLDSAEKKSRASVPRSKSGCLTCRARHVKCDEQKPACRRCISFPRKCAGYTVSQSTLIAAQTLHVDIAKYQIPFRIPGSQKQRQVLHYFCVQGSKALSGAFAVSFWDNTVLHYCHEYKVVRTCLTALAHAHLDHSSRAKTSTDIGRLTPSSDVLRQYGTSLRQLRKYIDSEDTPSKMVVLTCCFILAVHDVLWSHIFSAARHIDNGLAVLRLIFSEMNAGSGTPNSLWREGVRDDMEQLHDLFHDLDLELGTYFPGRVPSDLELIAEPLLHGPFRTIKEGRIAIQHLKFEYRRLRKYASDEFGQSIIPDGACVSENILELQNKLLGSLKCFSVALSNIASASGSEKSCVIGMSQSIAALQLESLTLWKEVEGWRPRNVQEFSIAKSVVDLEILDLCTLLLARHGNDLPLHGFSLQPITIISLRTIVCETRDLKTLQHACDILESAARRKEGLLSTEAVRFATSGLRKFRECGGDPDETLTVVNGLKDQYMQTVEHLYEHV